jgi:hypothetical protein
VGAPLKTDQSCREPWLNRCVGATCRRRAADEVSALAPRSLTRTAAKPKAGQLASLLLRHFYASFEWPRRSWKSQWGAGQPSLGLGSIFTTHLERRQHSTLIVEAYDVDFKRVLGRHGVFVESRAEPRDVARDGVARIAGVVRADIFAREGTTALRKARPGRVG